MGTSSSDNGDKTLELESIILDNIHVINIAEFERLTVAVL